MTSYILRPDNSLGKNTTLLASAYLGGITLLYPYGQPVSFHFVFPNYFFFKWLDSELFWIGWLFGISIKQSKIVISDIMVFLTIKE